jgi:sucrose phosphorylase
LDAVGYAIKTPGTDSFMTKETLAYVAELTEKIRARGMRVLVEVHAHYTQQLEIAPLVDLIYDFQTAPLLLHSMFTSNVNALANWLEIRPANCLNVLDTHDGYGVIDAGPIGGRPGLITQEDMRNIFEVASVNTSGHSDKASVVPQWFDLPHQINATLPAIINDDQSYVLARAVQFLLPGEPQVYYVGLFNGMDDKELFEQTGSGREVNRHHFTAEEIQTALKSDVTGAILGLARLRKHEVFSGTFAWQKLSGNSMRLGWSHGSSELSLEFEFEGGQSRFSLSLKDAKGEKAFSSASELANL